MIVADAVRDAQAFALTGRIARVEVFSDAGRLVSIPVTFGPPSGGASEAQAPDMVLAEADGVPVEYVALDADGQPVCRGTCGPKGSGADWEFARPLIQKGAPIKLMRWTHHQEQGHGG